MSGQTDGGILGALGDGVSSLLGNGQTSSSPVTLESTTASSSSTPTSSSATSSATSSTISVGPTAPSETVSTASTTTPLLESILSLISSTNTATPPSVTSSAQSSSSVITDPVFQTQTSATGTVVPTTFASSTQMTASVASAEVATSSPTATLQNESKQSTQKASGGPNTVTTAVAISAPIGGLAVIGIGILMYKKRGWMRRRNERGMRLDDDVQSLREVQQHEKFNPARNY